MWGRKDKKEKRGERRKGGGVNKGGMPFMGFGVPASKMKTEVTILYVVSRDPR